MANLSAATPDRTLPAGRHATLTISCATPAVIGVAGSVLAADGALGVSAAALAEAGVAASAILIGTLALVGRVRIPVVKPAALVAAGSVAVYAVLAYASAGWSVSPAASRQDAYRAVAYALAVLVGAAGATSRNPARLAGGLATALSAAVCGWAIIDRSFGAARIGFTPRLDGPLGHPNSLALFATVLVAAGLVISEWSVLAGPSLAGLAVVVLLASSSRIGVAVALVAVAVVVWRGGGTLISRLAAAASLIPAAVVAVWLATWRTFRLAQGAIITASGWPLVFATLAGMLASCVALVAARRMVRGRTVEPRRVMLVTGVVVVAAVIAAATKSASANGLGGLSHLFSTGADTRDVWWPIAWHAFTAAPWRGHGAGGFQLLATIRGQYLAPTSAHDATLDALAGTGILGGVLVTVGGGALGWVALRAADERWGLVSAVVIVSQLAHAATDVGWQAAPLGVICGLVAGVVAGDPRRFVARSAALLVAAAGIVLVLVCPRPWFSARALGRATETVTDPQTRLAAATDAVSWESDSVAALITQADAYQAVGRPGQAFAALRSAVRAEPDNFLGWWRLGDDALLSWHQPAQAVVYLTRAATLAPADPAVARDLEAARQTTAGG